jgi:hypothetical protein
MDVVVPLTALLGTKATLIYGLSLFVSGCEVRLRHLLVVQPGNITQVVMAKSRAATLGSL